MEDGEEGGGSSGHWDGVRACMCVRAHVVVVVAHARARVCGWGILTVSSAPPSPPHGACCTKVVAAMIEATTGVYPKLTLSPITTTFFLAGSADNGAPGLQTHLPVTLPAAAAAAAAAAPSLVVGRRPSAPTATVSAVVPDAVGMQVVVTPQLGQPCGAKSEHVVPCGQHVRPLEQHTCWHHAWYPKVANQRRAWERAHTYSVCARMQVERSRRGMRVPPKAHLPHSATGSILASMRCTLTCNRSHPMGIVFRNHLSSSTSAAMGCPQRWCTLLQQRHSATC